MNFITVFCHGCGSISEQPERNFLQTPYCVTCGSDFVENLSESTAFEASPEPLRPQEELLQGVRNPYFEDPFVTGLTERGVPYALRTLMGDPGAMQRMMEEAILPLNTMVRPQNGARDDQHHGTSGSLTAWLDRLSLQVSPTLPRPSAPDARPLKRGSVCGRNECLTQESCVICHEKYRRNESVITLQCDHVFHESCVMRWLQDHDTCPICRFRLPTRTIQSQPPTQTSRDSNTAPTSSPAARGTIGNASSSSGPSVSNASRNRPNRATRNHRRRRQANRTGSPRPSQVPPVLPVSVRHQEQNQQPSDQFRALRNEVLQTREREETNRLIQLQRLNDLISSSSNRGAAGSRTVFNRSFLS